MESEAYILEWAPSQNGAFPVRLQAHHATFRSASIVTQRGSNFVPACEPSQKGCAFERPHVHHQYSPAAAVSTMGDFCGNSGSDMELTW